MEKQEKSVATPVGVALRTLEREVERESDSAMLKKESFVKMCCFRENDV